MKSIREMSGPYQSDDGAHKFDGMSKEELLNELFVRAAAARSEGSLNDEVLASFVSFAAPGLDEQSRKRLEELARRLAER